MRLIDTDKLKFPNIAVFDMKLHGTMVPMVRVLDLKELMPAVDAVPLDNLCELLSHCSFPCDLLYLRCPYDECNKNTNDRKEAIKCWRDVLTRWMEEQNEAH